MNRSTFWMIKYMNGSVFSKARYMNGVGFEILARTPVPKLSLSYPPPLPPHTPAPLPEFITKQREVKNNSALVHSYHAGKAFRLSYFVNFGKIPEKSVSQHHYDQLKELYNIGGSWCHVISVYLHTTLFKIST